MKLIRKRVAGLTTALGLAFNLSGCQPSQTSETELDVAFLELGQQIVETHCAACHTANATGGSPRVDAPPLRNVLKTYDSTALADDFREHIHVGHPDMPDYDFTVIETEGLLAYLKSIQETPN